MKKISSALVDVASALFLGCVILAFASVIWRYVLNNSIIWAEELIRYMFIWLFFLAMPEVTRCGAHLALDLLPNKLTGNARKALLVAIEVLCIVFDIVIMIYGSKIAAINMAQRTASLRIPYGYVYAAIPVGAAIMLVFSARRIVLILEGKEEKA